jgi:hypothetical protein
MEKTKPIKYKCFYCETTDIKAFRGPKSYTVCENCESLRKRYNYIKSKNEVTGIIPLCNDCKRQSKKKLESPNDKHEICNLCIKIQEKNKEEKPKIYRCQFCHVSDPSKFEEHRRRVCRECKNSTTKINYHIERGNDVQDLEESMEKRIEDLKRNVYDIDKSVDDSLNELEDNINIKFKELEKKFELRLKEKDEELNKLKIKIQKLLDNFDGYFDNQ